MAAEGNASTTQSTAAEGAAAQAPPTNGAPAAAATASQTTPAAATAQAGAPAQSQPQPQPQAPPTAAGGQSALEELVLAATGRKDRPKPWVDVTTYPWTEDEFSARFVRRANYQELYGMKETGEEVDELIALLNIRPKMRVLDVCSGNGRHAIALALRGCKMTGIDNGPGPVNLARETSRNLGLAVDYRQVDALSISFEDAYDAAYLTCAGLSDFSPSAAKDLLTRIGRALVPGGMFVAEFLDEASVKPSDVRTWRFVSADASLFVDGGHLQLDERLYDSDAKSEVVRSYIVPSNGKMRQFARCRQYHKEDEVKALLAAASLQTVGFHAGSAPGLKKVVGKKG
ncbi:MAG TPA: class I SAM-dependent methyltransferase [Candidatus Eremiobacteraceae bacterium]|nr:class I SAM-dependent methyltransferase [Candidatus Eremiobacteraceae bacterium]